MHIFKIEGLRCGYNHHQEVLSVPFLELEAGKTIVVLGKSGYGKSTFLETLALMNNTIREGKVWFKPRSMIGSEAFDLGEFWKSENMEKASKLRSDHFSFIFQQTNLMPNFSVYENICIPKMIQGFPENECRKSSEEILERIGLSGIESDRKVTELSGGQRQRVAFARAVISDFDVVFGDEPTGNLDEVNSREIMQLLTDYIHQGKEPKAKTAIIVSHSIELAMAFADIIVMITWNIKEGCGQISQETVFEKEKTNQNIVWSNRKKTFSEVDFFEQLRKEFSEI